MSTENGTIATCPCIDVNGYHLRVDIRIRPSDVRSLDNHREVVNVEEALAFLSELQAVNMQPVKEALIQLWS